MEIRQKCGGLTIEHVRSVSVQYIGVVERTYTPMLGG
jgi:hypothetical protein